MADRNKLPSFTVPIPAGATVPTKAPGLFIRVIAATGIFHLGLDEATPALVPPDYERETRERFDVVTLHNPGASAITVTFEAGYGRTHRAMREDDCDFAQKKETITAGATVTPTVPAAVAGKRVRQVIIQNLHQTKPLVLIDAQNVEGLEVDARLPLTWPMVTPPKIKNPTANAETISAVIVWIFYK